jgi:hypothetical protein
MSDVRQTGQEEPSDHAIDEMTDEEAAEYYYSRRDEPRQPDEQVKIDVTTKLSRVISVRFDPQEAAVIEERAKAMGMTMSAVDLAAVERLIAPILQRMDDIPSLLEHVAEDVSQIRAKVS